MNIEYVSGFFDGEGSVCCYQGKVEKGQSSRVIVSIGQKIPNNNVVKLIHEYINSVGIKCRYRLDTNYSMEYALITRKNHVKKFLNLIQPFVVRKAEDVSRGLEFLELLPYKTKD